MPEKGELATDTRHVSEYPTKPPEPSLSVPTFDINNLFEGSAPLDREEQRGLVVPQKIPPDEKARQAYFWIVNHAIISPYYDIEFNKELPKSFQFKGAGSTLTLPTDQSYSSFVLLPLLNFLARKRALFIGGPGRGKTASAVLMGLLAGYSLKDLRRAILHGQPQLTMADMLGSPLPKDLLNAERADEIRIGWRKWLDMRVKIVDEYNRIPTRTQSALLTLVADGYAEVLDQVFECEESAWFLTANDDLGGGTYQVIEALKDRIDIVIRTLNFNSRFLDELLARIEGHVKPEDLLPPEIVFTPEELDLAYEQMSAVEIPRAVLRRVEFFTSQFDFCDLASNIMEYKSKDYIRIAGRTVSQVCKGDCGRDKIKALCSQTENGFSVRSKLAILNFAKALAYFRGHKAVELEDFRQIIPWLMHDKLVPNRTSPFFSSPSNQIFLIDKIAWIRELFDAAMKEYDRLDLDNSDALQRIEEDFNGGLDGLPAETVKERLRQIEETLVKYSVASKLYNYVYEDILKLKYFWMRYKNYLAWLEWRG
ncbi:MAG: ATPase [Promethearchaeota archaeon]